MQFYPHNLSATLAANVVSASFAETGSLINNFSAIAINRVSTASIALNITGSPGTNGTSVTLIGPQGPTGDRGEPGYRGKSIFLLSGSWHSGGPCTTPPANCYAVSFGDTYAVGGVRYCDFTTPTTYYSTDAIPSAGSPMYYNSICTSLASNANPFGAYASVAYSTNISGELQVIEACGSSF